MPSKDGSKFHVVVVGAGPGGLTTAMLLANRGFKVTVVEKRDAVGGRNTALRLGDYTFDVGPTFLMMKFLLDEIFGEVGESVNDRLDFVELDPMYELNFGEKVVFPSSNREKLKTELERAFPGSTASLEKFFKTEKQRFQKMYPCLQRDYSSADSMVRPVLLKALPYLSLGKSMHDVLEGYFDQEQLRISFTFQSKYLGMSPWTCPAAFMIIPYLEYGYGVFHVQGGLSRISDVMADVVREKGGEIRLTSNVTRLLVKDKVCRGVEIEGCEPLMADAVVINADFAHAMSRLVEPEHRRKYTDQNLRNRPYSCSTFMLYLGLDKAYPESTHHAIYFAQDYRKNIQQITDEKVMPEDFSFYVRNASVTDPLVAPEGHSNIYVLVPVPNNKSGLDWASLKESFAEKVLDAMAARTSMTDIREHIVEKEIIHPGHWEGERDVYLGATFNLAHTLNQMLYFRPRNAFEEFDRCYLVGGGTHPGSGLPTIYESGRISANLLCKKLRVSYPAPPPLDPDLGRI